MKREFPLIFYFYEHDKLCIALWNNRKGAYDTWFYFPTDHTISHLVTKNREEAKYKFSIGEWMCLKENL